MARPRGRPKTRLDASQIRHLSTAHVRVTEWRKAETEAHRAIYRAHDVGVPIADIAEAVDIPARTITRWCARAREEGIPDPEPTAGVPGESDALRLLETVAERGLTLADVERLLDALPD